MQLQLEIDSIIGPLFLIADENNLLGVHWRVRPINFSDGKNKNIHALLKNTEQQLNEFLAGKRKQFDIPFKFSGTPFQEKVWQGLTEIPYGETCSYQDLAKKINHPRAYRAVGTANGNNAISIIVPCHRVIAADGSLGGFGGGLPIKTKLLSIEKTKINI